MADITQLNQERQRLMQDFLQVKSELARTREELERIKRENDVLNTELEEREIAFQNLFSFVQESGM
jgi:septal ring factor EnvC (AmiA/AmiB activator)